MRQLQLFSKPYLRKYKPKDHHKPLNNNGIMKHIERFRKMVNMAVMMDWLAKDPFAKYKLHFDKVERGHLTQQELDILADKTFSIERLQSVLDMFLFSCFTGLAYIDMANLTRGNIVKGIDGGDWLVTNRQKTETVVKVPLLPQASALITKYHDHPKASNGDKLFPVISNQRMNGYLKEIADICEINKTLTFHIARHTFATTVTLSNGVPIESVSKMLGHTSIRTTQIYAKVVEHKLSEDMQNLRERMAAAR
nr:site-specific integrase [Olivibacter sitiensis]